tara:strand:+ start:14718 stop:14918 length:201 start_codon:yes stop_codon:yes gene_type:complete
MTKAEATEIIYLNDLSQAFHASVRASIAGLSSQAYIVFRMTEKLRIAHGASEDVQWRKMALEYINE